MTLHRKTRTILESRGEVSLTSILFYSVICSSALYRRMGGKHHPRKTRKILRVPSITSIPLYSLIYNSTLQRRQDDPNDLVKPTGTRPGLYPTLISLTAFLRDTERREGHMALDGPWKGLKISAGTQPPHRSRYDVYPVLTSLREAVKCTQYPDSPTNFVIPIGYTPVVISGDFAI